MRRAAPNGPMREQKTENRMKRIDAAMAALLAIGLAGCGGAYSGVVSGSGLGAAEYRPAVYVEPGNEARYEQVLAICRTAANNRQMTAAQEAQLRTLTGTAESTVAGAAAGVQFQQIFDMAGFDTSSVGDAAAIGAGVGLITGLVGAATEGAERTAAETKAVLLNCLNVSSRDGELWQVLEG